ncbi:MAG: carbamoyltransferase HypF [Chloroflexota bacterium]
MPAAPHPPEEALSTRCRLVVTGIVQGVGFRPFVHRLAHQLGLAGWVLNSTEGVVIEVEGTAELVDSFVRALPQEAPPLAKVDRVDRADLPPIGYTTFAIESSQEAEGHFALIPPDICVCDDCLREMRDPADRRYRYPFINCTNCGPRFTVVADIPYDRPKTTMACFPMCPECGREYHDPTNRRFHAQPNACPVCGPRLWLMHGTAAEQGTVAAPFTGAGDLVGQDNADPAGTRRLKPAATALEGETALQETRRLLALGKIVAVKGLGGFHLACDATNDEAVAELRRRKRRSDKPFAVMASDAESVATFCHLSDEERQLLESPQRPIVLLRRREDSPISPLVAPGNRSLGVMLPYTPLHYLLFELPAISYQLSAIRTQNPPLALVMTSGNLSEEPIATGNREALERLDSLADAFLLHDRDIQVRCDDSVTRLFRGREAVLRRSRGYAPFPVRLGFELRDILACGAELKSTFCITKGSYAFLSQHIGDLENAETLESFARSVDHFRRLFRLEIAAVAHDLHPEYLSTRYAWGLAEGGRDLPLVPVQHHHAHIAACMAENGIDEPVIGVSFDGTGLGDDGRLWGGEFLVCDFAGYRRAAHLKYLPLPGGEAAIKRPYRMAASYLVDRFGPEVLEEGLPPLRHADPSELAILRKQIERGINSPVTSSIGRLFDAVSSLIGLRQVVNYEGQAAIELEMAALEDVDDRYDWGLLPGEPAIVDAGPTIGQIVEDLRRAVPTGVISARFHNSVADLIAGVCDRIREETGLNLVALSGGVFQNLFLLERAGRLLEARGFKVLIHHQVPPNDGGIALGQAVIANRVMSADC